MQQLGWNNLRSTSTASPNSSHHGIDWRVSDASKTIICTGDTHSHRYKAGVVNLDSDLSVENGGKSTIEIEDDRRERERERDSKYAFWISLKHS